MSLSLKELLNRVGSWVSRTGAFGPVVTQEPMSAPGADGMTAGVWLQSMRPARSSGLASVSWRVTIIVRAYVRANTGEQRDERMMTGIDLFLASLLADLSLDGLVRKVDVFGEEGQALDVATGYMAVGEATPYRTVTVTLPVIINDLHVEAFQS